MNKRSALKLLAFLVGLYFVLEYLLPEKLGGDFDAYEVRSPAAVETAQGPCIFYAGYYRNEQCALGRLVFDTANNAWRRVPDAPVMQRSLFVPHDRWGMTQLAVQRQGDRLTLLYLGRNLRREAVLCYAESSDDGVTWQKRGPVIFGTNMMFLSSQQQPNGDLPGMVQAYAACWTDDGWHVAVIVAGAGLYTARGADLSTLTLQPTPLRAISDLPIGFVAFDAVRGTNDWTLYFVNTATLRTQTIGDDGALRDDIETPITAAGTIGSYRLGPDPTSAVIGVERPATAAVPPEAAPVETTVTLAAPMLTGSWTAVKGTGAQPRPTYLTRGIKWAGDFTMIVGGFAVFMAVINLFLYHSKRIAQRQPGLINSVLFFVFLVIMAVLTYFGNAPGEYGTHVVVHNEASLTPEAVATLTSNVLQAFSGVTNISSKRVAVTVSVPADGAVRADVRYLGTFPTRQRAQVAPVLHAVLVRDTGRTDAVVAFAPDLMKTGFDFTFKAFLMPLGIAAFSTITFYMISAAYRAFKVRSTEAVLLMLAAFIVMIGQLPLGAWLTNRVPSSLFFLQMPWLAQKLLMVANSSAFRGVLIGIMIGGLAAGLRMWLGMDESVYTGLDK